MTLFPSLNRDSPRRFLECDRLVQGRALSNSTCHCMHGRNNVERGPKASRRSFDLGIISSRKPNNSSDYFDGDIEYHVTIQNTKHNVHSTRKYCAPDPSCLITTTPTLGEMMASAHATADRSCRLQSLSSRDLSRTKIQTRTFALARAFQIAQCRRTHNSPFINVDASAPTVRTSTPLLCRP
jgi:hypothetical protein